MELIYTDPNGIDVNPMPPCSYDLAFGSSENDFACTVSDADHCVEYGAYIYLIDVTNDGEVNGTDYGGIVDTISPNTSSKTVTYSGRSWQGILQKPIEPPAGADYYIVSGDAHDIIRSVIAKLGLSALFSAPTEASGYSFTNYQFDRYIRGYDGLRKMLSTKGAKLKMEYKEGKVVVSATAAIDYSSDDEWDNNQFTFKVTKSKNFLNHLICLGKGDLAERTVIHLYQDETGNVSRTQSIFGLDEVSDTYDYPNAESEEELIKQGTEKLRTAFTNANSVESTFSNSIDYDIGDIVGASEQVTGVTVIKAIEKKIVKINGNRVSIQCKIGD